MQIVGVLEFSSVMITKLKVTTNAAAVPAARDVTPLTIKLMLYLFYVSFPNYSFWFLAIYENLGIANMKLRLWDPT